MLYWIWFSILIMNSSCWDDFVWRYRVSKRGWLVCCENMYEIMVTVYIRSKSIEFLKFNVASIWREISNNWFWLAEGLCFWKDLGQINIKRFLFTKKLFKRFIKDRLLSIFLATIYYRSWKFTCKSWKQSNTPTTIK